MLKIIQGGLDHSDVVAMLKFHFDTNISVTPAGSAHVFDLSRLAKPDILFWSAWEGDMLLGTGALKRLDANNGEIKSMHTLQSSRRTGVGQAILLHIMQEAKQLGLRQLWLETGSFDFFAPARGLYSKHGFTECPPFEGYSPDPNSTFMTRQI
jgi:putative acetyltransferase